MTSSPQNILPRAWRLIQEGIERKLQTGMQVYVSREFNPVADFAVGENVAGQPLSTGTLVPWLSSGKPITAVAAMKFVEAGALQLDEPVAKTIPEFAVRGKEHVTLRNILTHEAGLKPIATGWPCLGWEEIIARICAAPLKHNLGPDIRVGYDPVRSWFILGEMQRRVDGRPIERIVREDVLEPIGMDDCWMAFSPRFRQAYGDRIGVLYSVVDGELVPAPGHQPDLPAVPSPGGSMTGPVRELGLFYEMLLRNGRTSEDREILRPETVWNMAQRHRQGVFDATFQHVVDFGLGLIINSNRYGVETVPYGFGRHASESAFGHGGAQSSIGFADPEQKLVVAMVANARPGEELHNQRFRELNSAIYEDLGLVR